MANYHTFGFFYHTFGFFSSKAIQGVCNKRFKMANCFTREKSKSVIEKSKSVIVSHFKTLVTHALYGFTSALIEAYKPCVVSVFK
jgi:hypothetical protein